MDFKKSIKIGKKSVGGEKDPCFIIAEAGSNHNRNFKTAKNLIDAAKKAGVDAIKFQTYSAESLYPKDKKALSLMGDTEKPFDIIKKIEIPRDWQKPLADYAKSKGLIFMSTPFDKEAIDQIDKVALVFKWASPELTDRLLLEYAAKKKKPLILSTGFYGLKEAARAIRWVKESGNNQIILLHCTGIYPTEYKDVNLRAMAVMEKKFKLPVGFSDHTDSTIIPAASVAAGAKVIEKHFTLNKRQKGPDHAFALNPKELGEMVKNIRDVEKSLGNGIKKPVLNEIMREKIIRRGLVSKREILKGEKFSFDNIFTKRTGQEAIAASDFYRIIGKKAKKNIGKDKIISFKDAS